LTENHQTGRGQLCKKDLEFLSKWSLQTGESLTNEEIEEKFLHPEGELVKMILPAKLENLSLDIREKN
jgi:hypothetical protein